MKAKIGSVKEKPSRVSRSKEMADLEGRVADLERKLKTARRASKKFQDRVTTLEERAAVSATAFDDFNVWRTQVNARLTRLFAATDILHNSIDRILPEEPQERSTLKSSLGPLADQGGAIPVDGNAANILKGVKR
jgi:predicted  nucleic acid-binding Zn-ribbon protein